MTQIMASLLFFCTIKDSRVVFHSSQCNVSLFPDNFVPLTVLPVIACSTWPKRGVAAVETFRKQSSPMLVIPGGLAFAGRARPLRFVQPISMVPCIPSVTSYDTDRERIRGTAERLLGSWLVDYKCIRKRIGRCVAFPWSEIHTNKLDLHHPQQLCADPQTYSPGSSQ
jgi:hypothetical protein